MGKNRVPVSASADNAKPSGRLGDADYKALGYFRRTMREFLAFSAEGTIGFRLTSLQHQAPLAIRARDGEEAMSVGALTECLLIKNHCAIGLVSRLIDRAVVRHVDSQIDRRRSLVELTSAGHEAIEAISLRNLERLGAVATTYEGLLNATRPLTPLAKR